jgi:mRNA interferase MazF
MRRGDVYWADLEPVVGSESYKVRPAVIVSNAAANRFAERNGRGLLTIVPVTSNTQRVLSFQVLLPAGEGGLRNDSKAQAEQARSVSVERIGTRIGAVSANSLRDIDRALRMHLSL